jgi:flagellar biosynthesis/type III secretory pathway M-ring protein FliF/YscJ
MQTLESFFGLMVPLIRLVSLVVVIILFFFFIVRPFFNYLITNREIEHHKKLLNLNERADDPFPVDSVNRRVEAGEEDEDLGEELAQRRDAKLSELETLDRLTESDPDKATELIKKWVSED